MVMEFCVDPRLLSRISKAMTFAVPFPSIDPVLIDIGMIGSFPVAIRWYGLLWITGCIGAWCWVVKYFERSSVKVEKKHIDDFLVWAVLATVLGGRIGYGAFYSGDNFNVFQIWRGGLSFHGGLVGVIIAVIVFVKMRKIPFWRFSDAIACAAPIGLFAVRIANFINGELIGKTTNMFWGVVFPKVDNLARHPSQLYEAALEGIVLFLIMNFIFFKKNYHVGSCSFMFLIFYGLFRIFSEFFREPDAQIGYLFNIMSMGMFLSLFMIIAGVILFFQRK